MDVTELLIQTKERGGSDLHLSAGSPPMLRLHGELMPIESSTMRPVAASGTPSVSSGVIDPASASPATRCESGIVLRPPG